MKQNKAETDDNEVLLRIQKKKCANHKFNVFFFGNVRYNTTALIISPEKIHWRSVFRTDI
jgi:hypothetical protein